MPRLLYPSWRDDQATRLYPFTDASNLATFDGRTLPLGLLLDALIHPPNVDGGYYLEAILISRDTITFSIYDGLDQVAAAGIWSTSLPDSSAVPLYDGDGNRAGVLVVSPEVALEIVGEWEYTVHTFQSDSTRFVPSTWEFTRTAVAVEPRGSVSINSQEDLYLVGEDGMRLECREIDGQTVIVVHAIGDPLSKRATCGETFATPRFLQQIVFQKNAQTIACSHAADTNVLLVAISYPDQDAALRLQNTPDGIRLGLLSTGK